jgi:hypothetical protein
LPGHELARAVEAQEVLQLGDQRHGGDQLHAAHALQRLHQRLQACSSSCNARVGLGDGVQILLEADLLRCMFKLDPPERDGRAGISASRRSVLTRSPARLGIGEGATTSARDSLGGQVPPDHEPTRPGLVDHVQPMALADDLAQRLVQCNEIAPGRAHVPDLAGAAGIGHAMSMLSL